MRDQRPVRRVEEDPSHPAGRSAWWAQIPAVRALLDRGLDLPPGVMFLVGENGSGKSTIIEDLAGVYGLSVEGGSRSARHHTRETESALGSALRLIRTGSNREDQCLTYKCPARLDICTYSEDLLSSGSDRTADCPTRVRFS